MWALYALVVGLALHNVVMAMLWRAGVRGGALTAISAWKEVLLVVALALVVAERRALPISWSFVPDFSRSCSRRSSSSTRSSRSRCSAAARRTRNRLRAAPRPLIVGAYFLGRGLQLTDKERGRLCRFVLGTAAFVAVFGLVDVYAVSLAWWRLSAGWFSTSSG